MTAHEAADRAAQGVALTNEEGLRLGSISIAGGDLSAHTAAYAEVMLTVQDILRDRAPVATTVTEWETRSVWNGCRCGHPGAGCYCQSTKERTGRRRTVTTYAPHIGPWEESE